ncbi:hypothetical protein C8Q78DRAFT_1079583 [Trametes maxima]|nr:hypothetical protein C8Q78DRAFT_1079583 [Trametes maxima]
MPSSLSSRDSPRNHHARRRPIRGQLTRSGSLFGTLKNLVTAPLTWLTSQEDFEDAPGKRRRNPNAAEPDERSNDDDGRPNAKRKRVDSPEPAFPPHQQHTRTNQGYLDVPENLLSRRSQRLTAPPSHARASSFTPSLSAPSMRDVLPARRTASPAISASFSQPVAIQRTQSMDPPAYRPISLSRDVSMEDGITGSAGRDVTMSPTRQTSFQLRARSSLTPQPSGQTFGPAPQHQGRDTSEPPPLAALISNPVFVKPPPQHQQGHVTHSVTTLGTLAETKGYTGRPPLRQHSTLLLGSRVGTGSGSSSTGYFGSVNAAEKALHDLDVYKTPLLPSRLRGSQTIPEMFKPKKAHAPILMRSERERKPRLGTSEKLQEDEQPMASKPYAGRGGMKKMLAKRKMEEQEELERERASAIETDQDEEVDGPHKPAYKPSDKDEEVVVQKVPDVTLPPPEPAQPVRPIGGREQSSLRVGRPRTSRNHIARPMSKARNRFSAAFDEDEGEDFMLDEKNEQVAVEEPKKMPTLFESPKGFSFAPEKAPTPVAQDISKEKEPPIAALPFSFSKPATSTATPPAPAQPFSFGEPARVSAPAPSLPAKSETVAAAASAVPSTPLFSAVPSISLIPPSPLPPKTDTPTAAPASSAPPVPNFFANSSIFSKPGVTIAPPTPTPAPATSIGSGAVESAGPSGAPAASSAPFSFGAPSGPSLFGNAPQPATAEKAAPKAEAPKPPAASVFGTGGSSAPFSFGNTTSSTSSSSTPSLFSSSPAEPKSTTARPAGSLFGQSPAPAVENSRQAQAVAPTAPVAPAPVPASAPFSFGAPAKPVEPPASSPSPFSFGTGTSSTTTAVPATAPPFSFGASKADIPKEPENKPLFGTSEQTKPSLFGAPAPTSSPFGGSQPSSASAETAPKSPFTFGQPTQATTSAPTIEAPKPLFPSTSSGSSGGFSFGASAAPAAVPAAPATPATPAKSPFSFGASPATPPVTSATDNKPAFSFGAPSPAPQVSAPTTLFGGPSGGSNGADVLNKPFSFGAPARPATPPGHEQEMRMEESPTRGAGMNINGHEQKPSMGFSFGAPSGSQGVSPFGQPSQVASSPFSFSAKTETKTEPKPAAPFSFASSTSTGGGFGFGQKPGESAQSPISPAPFGSSAPFGESASNTPTASAPAFSFGASSAPSGGFGQSASSTPASPSTFGQPAPFAFGTPTSTTAPSNPFAFGSQPASPATSTSGLPQPPGSSGGPGFAFGQPSPATSQAPASPFGAAPPAPTGGVSFTMGSAAPQQQTAGPRAIKKLPNRRGGRQR